MYLCIDIGGTYIKYGYYHNDSWKEKGKIKTIKTNINEFYFSLLTLKRDNLKGIAISMPGLLDNQSGYIEAITLLPFLEKRNIKNDLENLFNLHVSIENDAKCAAIGEMWKGNLQGINNAFFMVIGSGIGGTIILNGEIINSLHHKTGEIGSILMPLDTHYYQMTNFGKNNNSNKMISDLSNIISCENDGLIVFEKLKNNKKALILFKQYCRQIAFMIYNLDYILDLDVVCIGGGISEQDLFINTIQNEFSKLREQYKEDEHEPYITNCMYHNEANLLGALYHHLKTHQI